MIEIRIGKTVFPLVAIASFAAEEKSDGDFLMVFLNGKHFWGFSVKEKKVAPLKFDAKIGKTVWGNKVVKFV